MVGVSVCHLFLSFSRHGTQFKSSEREFHNLAPRNTHLPTIRSTLSAKLTSQNCEDVD
jgi:hypothetical protein